MNVVTGKVLIIDDQEGIRRLLKEFCLYLGYETVTACSGENAVDVLAAEMKTGGTIRAALVDMKMQGMDGLETIRELHALDAGIKSFLMTGLTDEPFNGNASAQDVCGIVQKPFGLEKIKEILENAFSDDICTQTVV